MTKPTADKLDPVAQLAEINWKRHPFRYTLELALGLRARGLAKLKQKKRSSLGRGLCHMPVNQEFGEQPPERF
ncbi:MAG: hypothetical protein V1936_02615 [Patescibacteria group bacterium]